MPTVVPDLIITDKSPAPPIPTDVQNDRQDWRDIHDRLCASSYTALGKYWIEVPDVALFCFAPDSNSIEAFPMPDSSASLISDAFLHIILPMAYQAYGHEVLHGSGVMTPRGVIALCAVSGTGKSTLAYALHRRGYPLWADDAVAFELGGDDEVQALPLPFAIMLRPATLEYFTLLAPSSNFGDHPSNANSSPVSLTAIFLLHRAQADTSTQAAEISKLSPLAAFPALLPHAYCFNINEMARKQRMMRSYLDLVSRVPVYTITYPSGFDNLPLVLDAIEKVLH